MIRYEIWRTISFVLRVFEILLLARVVLSWIYMGRNALTDFVYRVTEPVLRPIRELIPALMGSIDLSPLIAFILLGLVRTLLHRILFGL